MDDALVFHMATSPRGQGRPRATARNGFATVYKAPKDREYETAMADVARKVMGNKPPLTGQLSVQMVFRMPIPKSETKRVKTAMAAGEIAHIGKPDLSNLQKAVEDAFNKIVFHDDSQITRALTTKIYSERPGVDVQVIPLEPQQEAT